MSSQGSVRQSGIPRQTYTMPLRFEDYILAMLGVITGFEGFNNNFLMAESFMKVLPQFEIKLEMGTFMNPFTNQPLKGQLDQDAKEKLYRIWNEGICCVIKRNPQKPEDIISRTPVFLNEVSIEIQNEIFARGFYLDDSLEVEMKPGFRKMNPVRDVTTNPVWREIKQKVPIRYALEGCDLRTLQSQGRFIYQINGIDYPIYTNYDEIYNSVDSTEFPSKNYFDETIDILFQKFLEYFNLLFVQVHGIIEERKTGIDTSHHQERKRIEL